MAVTEAQKRKIALIVVPLVFSLFILVIGIYLIAGALSSSSGDSTSPKHEAEVSVSRSPAELQREQEDRAKAMITVAIVVALMVGALSAAALVAIPVKILADKGYEQFYVSLAVIVACMAGGWVFMLGVALVAPVAQKAPLGSLPVTRVKAPPAVFGQT